MRNLLPYLLWLLWLLGIAPPAAAQWNGYVASPAVLRAGPAADYPTLTRFDHGDPLQIHGCLADWTFCDVGRAQQRGWLPAAMIDFAAADGSVAASVPTVDFDLDRYWDAHYRKQRWATQRARWRGLDRSADGSAPPSLPEPLRRQLASPPQPSPLPSRSESSSALSAAHDPAAWIPPGERMYRQLPPPDALNRKRNPKMFRELYGNEPAPTSWWPPDPAQLDWLQRHARP